MDWIRFSVLLFLELILDSRNLMLDILVLDFSNVENNESVNHAFSAFAFPFAFMGIFCVRVPVRVRADLSSPINHRSSPINHRSIKNSKVYFYTKVGLKFKEKCWPFLANIEQKMAILIRMCCEVKFGII